MLGVGAATAAVMGPLKDEEAAAKAGVRFLDPDCKEVNIYFLLVQSVFGPSFAMVVGVWPIVGYSIDYRSRRRGVSASANPTAKLNKVTVDRLVGVLRHSLGIPHVVGRCLVVSGRFFGMCYDRGNQLLTTILSFSSSVGIRKICVQSFARYLYGRLCGVLRQG